MVVLIVDDNSDDRKILRTILEHQGCVVTEAKDGREGLALAQKIKPEMIISDALMPRMDGFEFLRLVKLDAALRTIPFVFHSAIYTGRQDRELALSLGAEAFIEKPTLPEEFWETLTAILQKPAAARPMAEEKEYLRQYSCVVAAKVEEKVRELEQNTVERKLAEEALRESEEQRCRLEAELACAAEMQARLLPEAYPDIPGFEFAARCLAARQVGGDFYDWTEVAPGIVAITLGDVMGKGMSAAMLMTSTMVAIQSATMQNTPAAAVQQAERAIRSNLERCESFVTLFHAHLNAQTRTLTFVDCGHGHGFLRRADGRVDELIPRGLPLGVMTREHYQTGHLTFATGDALVLYSDGLIDARPELALDQQVLADHLCGAKSAEEMLENLMRLPSLEGPPPDDLTVLVVCSKKRNGDLNGG